MRALRPLGVALLFTMWPAQGAAHNPWSSDSANTIPEGRIELGLFHPLHWGVTDGVELSVHPLLALVFPHLDAKVRWLRADTSAGLVTVATRHRLTYPTLLLETVSREGSGGLLPANTSVPHIIGLDTAWLASFEPHPSALLTLELGLSVAPRLGEGDPVLLDFPFLYARFGALGGDAMPWVALSAAGALAAQLAYEADVRLTMVPAVPRGYSFEQGASVMWRPSAGFGLSLGYRLTWGRYPVGDRFHAMPTVDVLFGF